jgi:hypothetical protein
MTDKAEAAVVLEKPVARAKGDVMASVPRPREIAPELTRTKKYRIGTKEGSPRQNYTVAGICFPLYIERLEDQGGDTVRSREYGVVVDLTDEEVKNIVQAVARRVVREEGARRDILEIGSVGYMPNPKDVPMSDFLYMLPVEEGQSILQGPPK